MKDDKLDRLGAMGPGRELHRRLVKDRYEKDQGRPGSLRDAPLARESLVDLKVKEAEAEGQFKDLPGRGRPIDLSDYANTPEHLRTAYHVLKSGGFVPEEVRWKREMEDIRERLSQCHDPAQAAQLRRKLSEASQNFHMCMEYNNTFRKRGY